jgi:hypothetical protein
MGYTHYWNVTRNLTDAEIAGIAADVRAIVAVAPCPIAGWDGNGAPEYGENGPRGVRIALNGYRLERCESFIITPYKGWTFCKTRELPYDVVVTASLLAAKDRLGDAIHVESDGDPDDWEAGYLLAVTATGRSIPRYQREDTL